MNDITVSIKVYLIDSAVSRYLHTVSTAELFSKYTLQQTRTFAFQSKTYA